MYDFDLIIIGSGPAGEKAALQGVSLGAKVAVVERNNTPGGTSVLTGTIPSKAIRETACYINLLKKKELHGFDATITQNISALDVFHRHHVISNRISTRILTSFEHKHIVYIQGQAEFLDNHNLKIKYTEKNKQPTNISAPKIIIATGSKPFHPSDIKFDQKFILDSDSILKIEKLPNSIIIYGGGVIGCEYASIFSQLGLNVFLISPQASLLSFLDKEITSSLQAIYKSQNVELHFSDEYKSIATDGDQVNVILKSGTKLNSDILLYANGRQGNSIDLKLNNCNLTVNARDQLDVNDFFQTAVPNIYAVGDIIGFPALASVANEQGRCAASHALQGYFDYQNFKNIPLGVYTIPEVAMVGETEESLQSKNIEYETGICYFDEIAKAKMIGEEVGFLKILFHKYSKKILGVHILGYFASDLIHIGQAVLHYQGSLDYFMQETINFPTLSSAYKVAALNGYSKLDRSLKLTL